VPFGYLKFSHATREKPCPHMRAHRHRGQSWAQAQARARARVSGSLPSSVLFEPGLMGMGYIRSHPLRHSDLKHRNG